MTSVSPNTDDTESADSSETGRVVECSGLTKQYGNFTALSNCSLTVNQGDVFGLLGPNGAGKTTLIRTLLGYLRPTSGRCSVLGVDPQNDSVQVRRQVSYLPGEARLPGNMRGGQVLRFFSELHPEGDLERSQNIADQLELDAHRRVAFMSTGMRQKLALAVVFGITAPLLILDEPTANLDPSVRGRVLELVREARQMGRTIIFSSHVLSEIEDTCNRVVFLKNGELAHELRLEDLFQRHRITASLSSTPISVPDSLKERVSIIDDYDSSRLCIETSGDLASMLSWVDSLSLNQMRIEPLGLRTVYDSVHTGQLTREDAK